MSDMELTLTALAETTAAALSRARNSQGMQQLARDAKDAGEIAAQTLAEMERRIGQTIQSPADSAGSPSPLTAA